MNRPNKAHFSQRIDICYVIISTMYLTCCLEAWSSGLIAFLRSFANSALSQTFGALAR